MSQLKILNYSLVDRQKWACVEFWISYDADLEEVERIAVEAARSRPSFSGSETPAFWIMDMAKEGLRCWVAAWADTPSAGWMLKHETRLELVRVFKERGITSHVHRVETPAPRRATGLSAASVAAAPNQRSR
jgi:small-conductance mechanosensitive channel